MAEAHDGGHPDVPHLPAFQYPSTEAGQFAEIAGFARTLEPQAQQIVEADLTSDADFKGTNTKADEIWIWTRAAANFAAYFIYYHFGSDQSLLDSTIMGATGMFLSERLQRYSAAYMSYIGKHSKYFLVGKLTDKNAGMVEAWSKDLLVTTAYILAFKLVAVYVAGVSSEVFTTSFFVTVGMSWLAETPWSVLIANWTLKKRDQYMQMQQEKNASNKLTASQAALVKAQILFEEMKSEGRLNYFGEWLGENSVKVGEAIHSEFKIGPRRAWHLGKLSLCMLAVVSATTMVAGLNDNIVGTYVYGGLAVSGFGFYLAPKARACMASIRRLAIP